MISERIRIATFYVKLRNINYNWIDVRLFISAFVAQFTYVSNVKHIRNGEKVSGFIRKEMRFIWIVYLSCRESYLGLQQYIDH